MIVVKARLAQCSSSILMVDNRSEMKPVAMFMCYGPVTRWFPTGIYIQVLSVVLLSEYLPHSGLHMRLKLTFKEDVLPKIGFTFYRFSLICSL